MNNEEAISTYIDFPSVRHSLKDQMKQKLDEPQINSESAEKDSFAELGNLLAIAIIEKFIDKLFVQHQQNLINHLNQEFSHLYLPRNKCSEIFKVFHDLEKMKHEKFDRVHFQDFILGNP